MKITLTMDDGSVKEFGEIVVLDVPDIAEAEAPVEPEAAPEAPAEAMDAPAEVTA